MRETWVALILRLSAYIYRIKQRLLVLHAIKGFFYIFYIFFLEFILLLFSFPLYLIIPPHKLPRSGQLNYRIRRNITLIFLIIISCLWLGQLLFILIASRSVQSLRPFNIAEDMNASGRTIAFPVGVELATESSRIISPLITHSDVSRPNTFSIFGKTEPYREIILYAEYNTQPKFIKVYNDTSDENGRWSVYHDPQVSLLPAGTYRVYAAAYDRATSERSSFSSAREIVVHNSWGEWFRVKGSLVLNITVIIIVIIIFLLTLLTL